MRLIDLVKSTRNQSSIQHFRNITCTPNDAIEVLHNHNPSNRRLNYRVACRYAQDMSSGEWRHTCQAIVFLADGTLADGQHRLDACIRAGVPFQTDVVTGISDVDRLGIDNNKPRSITDFVHFDRQPRGQSAVSSRICSIANVAVYINFTLNKKNQLTLSPHSLAGYISAHEDGLRFADAHVRRAQGLGSASVCAAVFAAYERYASSDLTALESFCKVYNTGMLQLGHDVTPMTLRNHILSGQYMHVPLGKRKGPDGTIIRSAVRTAIGTTRVELYKKVANFIIAYHEGRQLTMCKQQSSTDLIPPDVDLDERLGADTNKHRS